MALPHLQAAMLEHTGNDGSGGREPPAPAGAACRALISLAQALSIHSLMPAGQRCLHQRGGAALVQQAADILQAVPLARPASMRADFNEAHVAAAGLLARLCCWMHPLEQQPQEGSGGVGAVHSTGGGIAAAQDASCAADEREAAAWILVQLVPHMAALLEHLAADGACLQPWLALICND